MNDQLPLALGLVAMQMLANRNRKREASLGKVELPPTEADREKARKLRAAEELIAKLEKEEMERAPRAYRRRMMKLQRERM